MDLILCASSASQSVSERHQRGERARGALQRGRLGKAAFTQSVDRILVLRTSLASGRSLGVGGAPA
jgi:hypothetical protein